MIFISRAYNSFELFPEKGTVVKISKTDRLKEEISFYQSIPEKFKIWFPRNVKSWVEQDFFDKNTEINFLELELYSYPNLGEYLTNKDLAEKMSLLDWENIALLFEKILKEFSTHELIGQSLKEDMKKMYVEKTWKEYKNLVTLYPYFTSLAKEKQLVINGKTYISFEEIWRKNEDFILSVLSEGANETPKFIHGDMCFSNILFGKQKDGKYNIIKFIDPRGKFGDLVGMGDPTYDYAKLMHSLDGGYEYFITDNFKVTEHTKNSFSLEYDTFNFETFDNRKNMITDIFSEILFEKHNFQKIKLIQALIYIGMIARHGDSFNRQLAMYLTGTKLLNEVCYNNKVDIA